MRTRSVLTIAGLAAIAGLAIAQPPRDATKPAQPPAKPATPAQPPAKPDLVLPPGMSEADMKACEAAATPGPQHALLAKTAGVWNGKTKMWMAPGLDPVESTCTTTVKPIMDGRFVTCETTGEMPGVGPFSGFGVSGFDNVVQQYQTTWIDNCGTGMGTGTGEVSADGKTITWKLTYNCPMRKKPITMRQIERRTGDNTMTFEIHSPDLQTGKEFKMLEITYARETKTSDATR